MVMSIILTLSLFVIFSGFSYKADINIRYFYSARIFNEYEKFQGAAKTFNEERQQIETDLQQKQTQLEQKLKEYENQQLLMSKERKDEMEKELQKMNQDIQQYAQEQFNQGGKLDQRWNELLQPGLEIVNNTINKIGNEGDFDLILDAKEGGIVVYGKPELDLTDKIMEELKKLK